MQLIHRPSRFWSATGHVACERLEVRTVFAPEAGLCWSWLHGWGWWGPWPVYWRGSQASARRANAEWLQARAAPRAEIASLYVRDILAPERRQATTWLAACTTAPRSLLRASDAIGVSATARLERDGRVLQVLPAKPALLGQIITGKYQHLAATVAGRGTVSNVVPSAARGVLVVGFAERFSTISGRRVFSGRDAYQPCRDIADACGCGRRTRTAGACGCGRRT